MSNSLKSLDLPNFQATNTPSLRPKCSPNTLCLKGYEAIISVIHFSSQWLDYVKKKFLQSKTLSIKYSEKVRISVSNLKMQFNKTA